MANLDFNEIKLIKHCCSREFCAYDAKLSHGFKFKIDENWDCELLTGQPAGWLS
jgi:hypothetical protein